MNNVLLYIGGLLAVALAALFAVPHFVDWNGYRGVFEEEASKVLGRDVRVGGAVNVRFLPTPYVRFEKVRLADPTGQTGEPFVRIDSFTMRLSGPALLRGVLEANEIELQRPILTLALDGKGGGNWANVQIKPGALPFVPQDVALHSVKLIDGAVALYNSEAQPIARADAINGELSADTIRGPFKFKGEASWAGEARDIKFATTVPETDGGFRVKASLRATKSTTTYLFDGRIDDLSGKPKLTGELTGKLPLDVGPASEAKAANIEPPVLDLKSRIEADTAGAKVEDIALSLDNASEPQLISGAATAVWGNEQRLDIALASKWLDLDRLAGAGQDSATFLKVKRLGLSSLRALAGDSGGAAGAEIDVEQVKLGGETVGGLKIHAVRLGGVVHLNELKAGLPGGSRLDLSGDLKDDNGKVRFAGAGFVHGTNLARLLAWAAKSGANIDVAADGPFSAEGRILVDDARFELTEASADVGGRAFTGDVVVAGEGRRKVAVTLQGARLDSSEIFPSMSRSVENNLRRAFGLGATAAKADPAAATDAGAKASAESGDVSVRVLAGEFKHGNQVFRNVDATFGLDGGSIRIPSAKFTTANGLAVVLDGRIDNAATEPKGTLAYDFSGQTPAALNDFATITGLGSILPAERLAATGSAKLAGLLRLGTRGTATADLSVDGIVEAAYVTGHAEFDGGLQGWRSAPSRVRVIARAPALAPLMSAFGVDGTAPSQPGSHEAELVFASNGALASGATALLDISAPGFEASYNGRVAAPAGGAASLAGNIAVKAGDMSDIAAVAGINGFKGIAGIPLEGVIDIARDGDTWTLASPYVAAGGSSLSGNVRIAAAASGPAALSADVHADRVTIAGLLAAVTDTARVEAGDKQVIWPEGGFNFSALANVAGDVRLGFATLAVQPDVAIRDGTIKLALGPDKAAISELTGNAAGGALRGAFQLTKASGGVSLDAALKIDGANLADIGATAQGKAGIDAKASALAQSPAALLAALAGSGTIALDGARLPVPGPQTGVDVVISVLANKTPNQADVIADMLRAAAQTASTEIGTRSIPFDISGGVAKLQPILLDTAGGTATGVTVVDLSTFAIDSAWRVATLVPPSPLPAEPLPGWAPPPPKGPLSAASIVYTGHVSDLKSLAVNADAADMQRELAVRIVERNLEDLERLKLQDQRRAKLELERRQGIEAERAAAKAAPNVAMPPVLPESAGTAAPAPTGTGTAAPAPQGTITVEPDPQATAAAAAPIVPAGEKPLPVVRPQPARVLPQKPPKRTTSDEVMRSLGGFQ